MTFLHIEIIKDSYKELKVTQLPFQYIYKRQQNTFDSKGMTVVFVMNYGTDKAIASDDYVMYLKDKVIIDGADLGAHLYPEDTDEQIDIKFRENVSFATGYKITYLASNKNFMTSPLPRVKYSQDFMIGDYMPPVDGSLWYSIILDVASQEIEKNYCTSENINEWRWGLNNGAILVVGLNEMCIYHLGRLMNSQWIEIE